MCLNVCVCVRQWSFWQWFNTTVSLDSLYLHTAALFHGQGVLVPVFKHVLLYHWDQVNTEPKDRQTDDDDTFSVRGDEMLFFFFGSERLKLQDSSGITAGQKVSVQPAESSMGRHQSTLFLHFFFASFVLFLLYLNRIMDSLLCFQEHRLQTTDYFLLLVKCI